MKLRSTIFALSLLAGSNAFGTVSLIFSSPTTGMASNWANSTGVGGTNLVWGIVIDRSGDGFDNSYLQGVDFSIPGSAQSLSTPDGFLSDDLLFISTNLMATPPISADGMAPGSNVITTAVSIPIGPGGGNSGDRFEIVWFDRTAFGGQSGYGESFGTYENAGFVLPPDASTTPFSSLFTGTDPLKPMNHTFVPEPGTALLGLLGLAGLLRRRR